MDKYEPYQITDEITVVLKNLRCTDYSYISFNYEDDKDIMLSVQNHYDLFFLNVKEGENFEIVNPYKNYKVRREFHCVARLLSTYVKSDGKTSAITSKILTLYVVPISVAILQ